MKTVDEIANRALRTALSEVKSAVMGIAGVSAKVILYGSCARGDDGPDSDVDLLVVLPDEAPPHVEDDIRDAIYDIADRTDLFLSVMVVTEAQATRFSGFRVFGNVEKEGIPV